MGEGSNARFEQAVLAVVDGEEDAFEALLKAEPELVRARSADEFGAPLLHHVAANGVPDELQRTPPNAVEICRILLEAGADPDATSQSYGGGVNATVLCLLVSSRHPHERRVATALIEALAKRGASIDGLGDDGAPLATALLFGYTRAAETLARLGCRIDNLYFAAGLGKLDVVRGFFDGDELREGALGTYAPPIPKELPRDSSGIVQEALHFAVTHGRSTVAEFLFERGADPNGRVTGQHCELPLLQTLFVQEFEQVPLLLAHGADPRLFDEKRRTSPLEHARQHGFAEVAALLERHDN